MKRYVTAEVIYSKCAVILHCLKKKSEQYQIIGLLVFSLSVRQNSNEYTCWRVVHYLITVPYVRPLQKHARSLSYTTTLLDSLPNQNTHKFPQPKREVRVFVSNPKKKPTDSPSSIFLI